MNKAETHTSRNGKARSRPSRRPGFSLVEATIAALLLAIAMTAALQFLGWMGLERIEARRRLLATNEIANLMERITARPAGEITNESVRALIIRPEAKRELSDARLSITVQAVTDPPGKRVMVELRWMGRSGRLQAPVRLTAWVHEQTRDNP